MRFAILPTLVGLSLGLILLSGLLQCARNCLWSATSASAQTKAGATFGQAVNLAVGTAPQAVVVADFNGDGDSDLAVTTAGSSDVSVLLGAGDGSFARFQSFPIRVEGFRVDLRSIAAGDLNGDGVTDLVMGCENACGSVFILLGDGSGSFPMLRRFCAGRGPVSVVIKDLNGDGFADLVAALLFNDAVAALFGRGDGTFPFADRQHFDVSGVPRGVAVADLNSDGVLDIVAAAGDLAVLLGAGDGTFAAEQRFGAGGAASAVAVGDVNGDAVPDVVTANAGSDGVAVLLGHGDGTLAPAEFFPVGRQPSALAVADLNRDGRPDIVTSDFDSNDLSVLMGKGDGTFAPPESFRVGDGPRGVAVADLNRDGRPDIVTANSLSDDVSVLLAEGPPICIGDCDGDQQVTVDEILRAVNVALGGAPLTACAVADRNTDGRVTIDELIAAVNAALDACTAPGGNAAPTAVPTTHG